MNLEKKWSKLLLVSSIFYFTCCSSAYSNHDDLLDLSVEDLLNVEVTSVARKAKSLNDSPAAIFVISQEDIKRIGATSVPEALRLAPGINVARIDANKWAVSARGFNSRFANKLLVLIDGRSVYTPTFSGVYWENQDLMLEDVERIEVIRGPGATLWGANAVNGIVNIISKNSADTQGALLTAGGGTEEQGFGAFRYGGKLNSETTARAYVKGFKRDENTLKSGAEAGDDWDKVQGGFRLDSQWSARDTLTIQGDAFNSNIKQQSAIVSFTPPFQTVANNNMKTFGGNLLVRQQHSFSSISDYSLQVFYDFYERDQGFVTESRHTIDFEFQHRFSVLDWNDVIWGLGYRYTHDDWRNHPLFQVNPRSRNDQLFSAFVKDEITLIDNSLWLTLGSKFEYNDYSGFEAQPSARLMWAPHYQHRFWAGVSRAVRTPSRVNRDAKIVLAAFPTPPTSLVGVVTANGNKGFDAEDVISYELGYRTTFINNLSIDFTGFYNDYNNLWSVERGTPFNNSGVFQEPLFFDNNSSAHTYGFEIAMVWQMLDWWRWDANYSFLKMDFEGQDAASQIGITPQQSVSLRSAISLIQNIDLDVLFRYVDRYSGPDINAYVSMDIRLAWRPVKDIELSLVGQNLLAEKHLEYINESFPTPIEIDRGMYGKLVWEF